MVQSNNYSGGHKMTLLLVTQILTLGVQYSKVWSVISCLEQGCNACVGLVRPY